MQLTRDQRTEPSLCTSGKSPEVRSAVPPMQALGLVPRKMLCFSDSPGLEGLIIG